MTFHVSCSYNQDQVFQQSLHLSCCVLADLYLTHCGDIQQLPIRYLCVYMVKVPDSQLATPFFTFCDTNNSLTFTTILNVHIYKHSSFCPALTDIIICEQHFIIPPEKESCPQSIIVRSKCNLICPRWCKLASLTELDEIYFESDISVIFWRRCIAFEVDTKKAGI